MFIHVHYPLNQNANFFHSVLKGILPILHHAHTLLIFLCYVGTRQLIINHLHYRKGNVTFHNNFIKSTLPLINMLQLLTVLEDILYYFPLFYL